MLQKDLSLLEKQDIFQAFVWPVESHVMILFPWEICAGMEKATANMLAAGGSLWPGASAEASGCPGGRMADREPETGLVCASSRRVRFDHLLLNSETPSWHRFWDWILCPEARAESKNYQVPAANYCSSYDL